MLANETFLNQLIKNHHKAAQEMALAVLVHVILAIAAFKGLPIIINGDLKELAGVLGGSIFGGLGFIPGKEILDRREKARNLEAARPLLQSLQQNPTAIDAEEQKRLKEMFLKLIEKTVSG
ncbi:hypothetical protein BST81_12275 [Leptolyngbya sp. 'hensonii']|uniref:hypothetical protein n=1 Tax=Leptolyngbya sp. 'hensonii' TaxID=1922337 RepID=UPI00094FAAE9|nr:hypothetical protein [Leptolyngbya sp. 'hensonii']OLP17835.1 hypothetical protein BST81_12275 [Leptolyngbya sp. 'hensonii']